MPRGPLRKRVTAEMPESSVGDIIALSTELTLNEGVCMRHYLDALRMLDSGASVAKDTPVTVARRLYYAERRDVLMAILKLVQLRDATGPITHKFLVQTNKSMLVRSRADLLQGHCEHVCLCVQTGPECLPQALMAGIRALTVTAGPSDEPVTDKKALMRACAVADRQTVRSSLLL